MVEVSFIMRIKSLGHLYLLHLARNILVGRDFYFNLKQVTSNQWYMLHLDHFRSENQNFY